MGGKIYVDKRVLLRHSGSYVFCMENQAHLLNTVGPMYVEEKKKQAELAEEAKKAQAALPATTETQAETTEKPADTQ